MKEAVFEIFERINQIQDESVQIQELRKVKSNRLGELIASALNPNIKWNLPEGSAPFKPSSEINTHGMLWYDIRRLYLFLEGPGIQPSPIKNNDSRREILYIQILESIHPRDADMLNRFKDKQWPYENISMDVIDTVFPGIRG